MRTRAIFVSCLLAPMVFFSALRAQEIEKKTGKPAVAADHAAKMKQGVELFKSEVRELLKQHCLKCHGGQWTKGDFDLSSRKALLDSGMIEEAKPGSSEASANSHLLLLLRHEEEPHMPKDAPPLTPKAIATIAKWIDLGAPYDQPLVAGGRPKGPMQVTKADREFWAFRPLSSPAPPKVDDPWVRSTIDRYIIRELRESKLEPNRIANKRVLIRRAYFDLLGLPPSPAEVQAFLADSSEEAYPHLIDRLLESPRYGERWARHWMDVARFAESHGYEQDYDRPHAYHYRDFLIRALNDDMPYDQFVAWQLAGDELAPDNPLAMMATGFLGAGVFPTQLTEAEFESARYDELDDMTTTTGVAFLGLSVGCARCHDHKFDPIPTLDYYRLAATFTSTIRSELDVEIDPSANQKLREAHAANLAKAARELSDYDKAIAPLFEKWLRADDSALSKWTLLDAKVTSTANGDWTRQSDGSWLANYPAPAKEVLTVTSPVSGRVGALRLEALTDASLPRQGPGRAANGNFALGDIRVRRLDPDGSSHDLKFSAARATHQQNDGALGVAASIDGDGVSGWAVDAGGIGKDQAAVFDLAEPFSAKAGQRLEIKLVFNHPNTKHVMGRIRLSTTAATAAAPEVGDAGTPGAVVIARQKLREAETVDLQSPEAKIALEYFLSQDPGRIALKSKVDALQKGPAVQMAKVQVSSEGVPHMKHHADGRGYPHFYKETHFLNRGDVNQKQDVVENGFLQVLTSDGYSAAELRITPPTGRKTSFRRATLANWITDPDRGAGHLAARVIVNRLWHHHFGVGLVSTPNDFGFQGERPSHPELLDYLASDLIANQWRLKRLHKAIMTSAAYMQSSETGDANRGKVDPDNRLLWRRTPRRLEAEPIRDSMLSVAGMLDETMYGPGVLDINMKRRSIYFFIKRSQLISPMMLFDWPEHLVSIGSRANTTIAPQALMFMNSEQGRAYAAGFASRLPAEYPQAVDQAYWLAFGRAPTPQEASLSIRFLESQEKHYGDGPGASDLAKRDFCQAMFSSNEFIYVD